MLCMLLCSTASTACQCHHSTAHLLVCAGAGLPQFFLVMDGPLASFPPLSDATLAMFAVQIASSLNLPPPYSAASLVTWFQSATLGGCTHTQQALQLVVGYAVRPEAALPLQTIPLQAIAAAPGTVLGIADGLHSTGGFITGAGSSVVIAASHSSGQARGTPVPISGPFALLLLLLLVTQAAARVL